MILMIIFSKKINYFPVFYKGTNMIFVKVQIEFKSEHFENAFDFQSKYTLQQS